MTEWKKIWEDNFEGSNGSLPDESKWNIIVAPPNADNEEVQHYTRRTDNVSIHDGTLHIKPQHHDGRWTSARLEGKTAFHCPDRETLMLKAEIRTGTAPPSKQSGIWPAFWTLGDNLRTHGVEWPKCGEMDILETAHGQDYSLATAHYGANEDVQGGSGNPDAKHTFDTSEFHTWTLVISRVASRWQDETMWWDLDGKQWFKFSGSDVGNEHHWATLAHKDIFPILNVAVGSNFPGGGQPNGQTATGLASGLQVKRVAAYKTVPPP